MLTPLWCSGGFAVIKLEGSTPVRYGLRLNMDEKYMGLKRQLSELCSLKPEQILLAEVHTSNIKVQTRSKKQHWCQTSVHIRSGSFWKSEERNGYFPNSGFLCVPELSSGQPEGAAVR